MSNTENQIETLNALKRDVREVINEWKAEKSAIEAQRNELFTSLQRQVGELVSGANQQLQEVTTQLATQTQQYQQLANDYQTQKNEYEQFKINYEQTFEQQKQNLFDLQGQFNKAVESHRQNLNTRTEEYTEKINTFERELQNKKDEYFSKAKELQEEFNTKKDDLVALSQKQREVFESIQKEREENYKIVLLELTNAYKNGLSEDQARMNATEEGYIESFDEILSEAKKLIQKINDIMPGAVIVKLARSFQKAKIRYGPDDDKVEL